MHMRLFLRLMAMLLPTLVGLQVTTQLTAKAFRYHPALGTPWLRWHEWRVYAPWRFGGWLWAYGPTVPEVFRVPLLCLVGGVSLGFALLAVMLLFDTRHG